MKIKNIELNGEAKRSNIKARGRLRFSLICLFFGFFLILLKVTHVSILHNTKVSGIKFYQTHNIMNHKRADIVDRNGELLATTLPFYDLCANPKLIKNENKKILAKSIAMVLYNESEEKI